MNILHTIIWERLLGNIVTLSTVLSKYLAVQLKNRSVEKLKIMPHSHSKLQSYSSLTHKLKGSAIVRNWPSFQQVAKSDVIPRQLSNHSRWRHMGEGGVGNVVTMGHEGRVSQLHTTPIEQTLMMFESTVFLKTMPGMTSLLLRLEPRILVTRTLSTLKAVVLLFRMAWQAFVIWQEKKQFFKF